MIWLLIFSCSNKKEQKQRELLNSLGENVFVENYELATEKAKSLHEGIVHYCADPNNDSLNEARDLWWSARAPWKEMELLKFGPYIDEPHRLGPKIDFWPVRTDTIDEILQGEIDLNVESFRSFGTSSKGFPAIEYLLFADHNREVQRYCQYLEVASIDLHYYITELHNAWSPDHENYLSNLTEVGESKAYETLDSALAEIVNRMGHTIANIRADKLRKPLGLEVGYAQEEKLESRFSHRSIQDILDNLEGIKKVFYGVEGTVGLSHYLKYNNVDLEDEFQEYLNNAIAAAEGLQNQGTLAEAILIDPEGVLYFVDRLGALQSFIQLEVLSALSLWLTFNDADGD